MLSELRGLAGLGGMLMPVSPAWGGGGEDRTGCADLWKRIHREGAITPAHTSMARTITVTIPNYPCGDAS
ncbi:hypothetical protein GCM10009612_58110 [Streptomyces beijiangensis]